MQIRRPTREDVPALTALWAEAFGEGDAYCPAFFDRIFCPGDSLVAEDEQGVCAMLHTVRKELYGRPARYLYAVATAGRCRGRGIFTALHQRLLETVDEELFFLIPEREELRGFYRRFGYRDCAVFACAHPQGAQEALTCRQAWELYDARSGSLALRLTRQEFCITAMGKHFFKVASDPCPFYVAQDEAVTSFFEVSGSETAPGAMVLARCGAFPGEFVLPFFLN